MAWIAVKLDSIGEGPLPGRFKNTYTLVEGSSIPVGSYPTDQLSLANIDGVAGFPVATVNTQRVRIHNIAGYSSEPTCIITFWPGTNYAFTWDLAKFPMAGSDFPILGPPLQGLKYDVSGSTINNLQLTVSF